MAAGEVLHLSSFRESILMASTVSRRFLLATVLLSPFIGVAGCNGPDNPKLADAPVYTPPADPGPPPKIQGKRELPGQNKKYQEFMEKRAAQQQGR